MGEFLLQALRRIDSPLIRDIRGAGLFVGLDIDPARGSAREVCLRLMEKGILSKETHETVVRLAPPLSIEREQLAWAVARIEEVLDDMERLRKAS